MPVILEAVKAYAGAIVDTINKYGYDGFDYDYEPTFSSPFKPGNHCGTLTACPGEDKTNERLFITTMRELLGPDKILNLNGSIWHVDQDMVPEFNYFVYQNYGTRSDGRLEGIYSQIKNAHGENFDSKKLVFTESYERNSATTGGATSTDYEEGSVVGMSRWNPTESRKGGVGIYHVEMGYTNTPPYKHLRKAIAVMNPPVRE